MYLCLWNPYVHLPEEDAVICLPPFISSESLSPSISTMSSLYFHCIFIYMYACVCVKFTSRSHRWDVRENMLYLYAESHLFQSASIFSSVQLSCKWHYNIIFNIVYACWVVDVLENSVQLSVTALLLSENMHSALTCLGIYLDSQCLGSSFFAVWPYGCLRTWVVMKVMEGLWC